MLDPDPEPDSLEMLDPDPDPQHNFWDFPWSSKTKQLYHLGVTEVIREEISLGRIVQNYRPRRFRDRIFSCVPVNSPRCWVGVLKYTSVRVNTCNSHLLKWEIYKDD
jgi:hypothetical protein